MPCPCLKVIVLDKIRISIGTAKIIGLERIRMNVSMKTAYLLTYYEGKCLANCKFCAQGYKNSERIARGLYKAYPFKASIKALVKAIEDGKFSRICLQTINYPNLHKDVVYIVEEILSRVKVPISVSRHPLSYEELEELKELGVDRIVIPLDAVTKELFGEIKPFYSWEEHWQSLERATEVFNGKVGTHIILGFGETEEQAIKTLKKLHEMNINAGLFAFVPLRGTPLENHPRPKISSYRRIQLAYYLIKLGFSNFSFEEGKIKDFGISDEKLEKIIASGKPFLTTGCPSCTRPYSTESPSSKLYNFPFCPSKKDIEEIKLQLEDYS